MSHKDGGTAFPSHKHYIADREGGERKILTGQPHGGMSLRDYFAAQALASFNHFDRGEWDIEAVASDCYRQADAMLRARVK
jgi:hypothetical protein